MYIAATQFWVFHSYFEELGMQSLVTAVGVA
jgi:hypothetical protein